MAQSFYYPTLYLITMTPQNYTLKDLKESVDRHIEDQGEDALCAAWIYTKYDVAFFDKDWDLVMHEAKIRNSVLANLWDCDSVHTVINDCIDVCLKEYQNNSQASGS
jgi:hypothetical protein